MSIERIDDSLAGPYERFRTRMWPDHPAAGHWSAARLKYLVNPQAVASPGSGLYGYMVGGEIVGCMGAYPMPVTLDGKIHPGHMLVDWAVLPQFRFSPIAGRLFQSLLALPGRKFGSTGTPDSQGPLSRRANRISAAFVTGILRPIEAAAVRYLRLLPCARPSPVELDRIALPAGVTVCAPSDVRLQLPAHAAHTAYVARDAAFWDTYLSHRNCNGAIALSLDAAGSQATVVFGLAAMGRFQAASLLSVGCSRDAAASCGRLFGEALRRLGVCVLFDNCTPDTIRATFVKAAVRWRRAGLSHWWAIGKSDDAFRAADVNWFLTAIDRDSHWGGI